MVAARDAGELRDDVDAVEAAESLVTLLVGRLAANPASHPEQLAARVADLILPGLSAPAR